MNNFFQGFIESTFDVVGCLLDTCRKAQKNCHIYLFGCGGIGVLVLDALRRNGIEPFAFSSNDTNLINMTIRGLKVVSFENMIADSSKFIIISTLTSKYIEEMADQLHQNGVYDYHYSFGIPLYDRWATDISTFSKHYSELDFTLNLLNDDLSKKVFCASINAKINGSIINDRELLSDNPIFLDNILSFNENEVYFDIGAYTGDNALRFLSRVRNAKIFSFEPDPFNYSKCLENTNNDPRITIFPYGCGEFSEKLSFVLREAPNTSLLSQAQTRDQNEKILECNIVRLDDYIEHFPTFISMDIEGGELSALKGAKKIIAELKPKLAVALYHNAADFWEIPRYLLNLRPDYEFYVRTSHFGGESCVGYFI